MALNIVKLIDLIKKHNDPNDATRIISIQGTSVANFFPERMKKDDVINIESGDIVWKEYGDHKEQDPVIYRTGLNNIDQIKFIPAPGEDIFLDNGKVDTGNGKDTVEGDDGTKYKLIPGPQGDKGETGARGEKGEKGDMSIITLNKENGHWMIDGVDTEVSAIGPKGDKVSVTIDPNTKHWMIDGVDTEVVAEGKDGKAPEVKIDPVTKRWIIGGVDTNIVSEGVKGDKGEKTLVTIDPNTKHWLIDGVDTNVLAEGIKGDTGAEARLSIDPETKHFIINGVDSGVRAEGVKGIDGVTPEISINEISKNWIINGHDTEIKAEGTKGDKGEKTLVTIDPNTKHWLIDGVDTNVLAEGTKGVDGVDGKSAFDIATEKGFTGSKDEWLESLKGAKGVDGHDGRSANNLEVDPILLGNFRNNDASGIEVLMIGPRFNDEELSESEITENLQVTALFRGFNLRNSNENDEWKDLNNLTIEPEDGNYVVKGLPFTDGVRKGDSLELILNFEYKGVDRHYYRRLDNINDGVGSVNLDKYIRREDLPATLDTSHLIARKEVEETYAKKSELPVVPSLDPYSKKEDADNKYATKESLSSVSVEVSAEKGKLSSLTDRVTAIEESKSTLATKEEVDTTYAKKSELPVVPSLDPYATKAESDEKYVSKEDLVTLGNLNDKATKADLKNYYTKEETVSKETHDALNNKVESNVSEISTVKEKVAGLESSNTTVKEKIESLTSDVNSLKAKEDSDKQTLSLEGNKLAISSGNEVDLSALKTDNSAIERSVSTLNETVTGLKNRLPESIQEDDKLSTSKEVTEKVNSLKTEVETNYAKKSELPSVEGLITESKADGKYSSKSLETTVSSLDEKVRHLEAKEDNDRQTLSIDNRTITISGSNSSVTVPEQDLSGLATKTDVERDYAKKSELPNVEEIKRRVSTLETNGGGSSNTNNGTKYYVRTVEELKALDVQVDDVVRFKDKVYKIVKDVTPFSLKYFGGIILDKIVDRMNLVAIEYTDSYIRNSWIKNRPSGNFNIAYCGYTGLPYKSNANLNSVPCTLKAISDAYKVGYDGIYVPTLKYFNNKWYISTTDEVGPIVSNSQGVELLSYSYTHTRINSEIAETKTFNSNNYVDRNLLTVEEFLNVCKKYNMYAFMSIQTINKNTFDNSSQEAYAELARIINDSGHSSMIGLSGDNIQIEILDYFVIRVRDKILSENLINVIFIDASAENYNLERELLILQKYKNNLVIIGDRDDHDGNEILSAYGPSHKLYNFLKEVKKMGIPIVYQTDRREQRELFDKVIEKTGCIGLLSSAIAPYGKNLSDNYAVQSRNNMSSIINLAVNKDNMSSRFTMNSDNTIMTATASNITQNNEFELLNVSNITDGMLIRVRLQGKTSGSQTASCKIYVKDIPDNENISNMISFNSSVYKEREMILPLSKNTFDSRYNDKKVVINLTADSGDSIISFKDLVVEVLIPKDKDNNTTKLISSVNYESYNNKDIYVDSEIQKAKLGDMIHYNNEDYVVVSKDDELISGLVTESTNGIIKIGENYALRIHNQEDINQWLNGMKNTDNIKIADGGFTGKSNVDNEFVPVYPKNTTLSVEKAGELGFDAVKVNITPTKDNVWVCSDETTLVNVKDNSFKNRNIADLNYDNIKGLELEGENVVRFNKDTETYRWTYRDGQCKGQTIPSLEQIVKICSKYGMMIFITSANLTDNFDYVTKVLKKYGYTSRTALVGDRFIMKYSNKLPDAVSIFDGSMNNVKIYNEKFLRTFKNFGFTSTPGGVNNIFRQTSNFKIDIPFFLNANYQYNLGNYQSLSNFRINGFITGAVPSDLNIREGYSILRTYTSKEINEWTDRKNNNSASASVVKQSNGNIIIQSSGGSAGKYINFEKNLEEYPVGTIINISAMCRKIEKNVDGGTISFWSDTRNPRRINTFTEYFNEEFFEKKDLSFVVNEETDGTFQIFIGNFNGVRNDQPFKAEFKDIVVRIYVPNAVYRDIDKESIERKIADISFKTEMEIRGEGYPRHKSELNNVPNGTVYTDTLVTKGAVKWIKLNGKWKVTIGDTGWKKLNTVSTLGNAFIKVRRVNDIVTYSFGGLTWGWFGIIRRGGKGFLGHNSSGDRGAKVLAPGGIPYGFRSDASLMGPIFNDLGKSYGIWYLGGKSDANFIQFTFNDIIPTDKDIGDIRVSSVSYITDDDWEDINI